MRLGYAAHRAMKTIFIDLLVQSGRSTNDVRSNLAENEELKYLKTLTYGRQPGHTCPEVENAMGKYT